jgi:branched-chain amino acid transport system permease protein
MPHIRLRDFTMHYLERGAGAAPVVFVAGFIATHRWWLPTLERIPADYRAYAVDLRGTGQSETTASGYALAQLADDLHQFVEALGLARFALVGHSLGGGVALQYALEHPDRLTALALVDPLAASGTRLTPEVTDWINAQCGVPDGIRAILVGAFATPPTGAYLEQLESDGLAWGQGIYQGMMDEMARFNVVDRLPTLAVPTVLTWGDKDGVIPFAAIAEIFTAIPGCGLEIWHGVGHTPPIEIPDRFVALLTGFLAEAVGRAA